MKVLSLIFVLSLVIYCFFLKNTSALFVYDTDLVVMEVTKEAVEAHLEPSQVTLLMNNLKSKIQQTLNQYANTHHVIILDKKYVKAGGEDITRFILDSIKKEGRAL